MNAVIRPPQDAEPTLGAPAARRFLPHLPLKYWLATLLAVALLVLSVGPGGGLKAEYHVDIAPLAGKPGSVILVFYANRFDQYVGGGELVVPAKGWQVARFPGHTTLTAQGEAAPVRIAAASDDIVRVTLLRHKGGGAAVIDNGAGERRELDLRAAAETTESLVIGGTESSVRPTGQHAPYGPGFRIATGLAAFGLLLGIALRLAGQPAAARPAAGVAPPARWELAACALPLLAATTVVHLAFLPGNVSFDGALQWVQAATRGQVFGAVGLPATYLMRGFALLSPSPLPLIVLQCVLAAVGFALVLRELRHRGVPFGVTFGLVLLLAATPQYATFFTALGKDALCAAGLLFYAWALLAAFRRPDPRAPTALLAVLVGAGLFAGLIRNNVMPVVLLTLVPALVLLYRRRADRRLLAAGAVCLAAVVVLPNVLSELADRENGAGSHSGLPLGTNSVFYMYHLFSALLTSGVPLPAEDTAPFFRIAPRDAWTAYDCSMTDKTMLSVTNGMLLSPKDYHWFMRENQVPMASGVARLMLQHPHVLLQRQACITRMLWWIGAGERPFQMTGTLGYDEVSERFVQLAGPSHTHARKLQQAVIRYMYWSEGPQRFWLFWKPALPLLLGFFVAAMYLARRRDTGVLLVAAVPLLTIASLLVVIPFPAYRYAYPSVLLCVLLVPLVFARQPAQEAPSSTEPDRP